MHQTTREYMYKSLHEAVRHQTSAERYLYDVLARGHFYLMKDTGRVSYVMAPRYTWVNTIPTRDVFNDYVAWCEVMPERNIGLITFHAIVEKKLQAIKKSSARKEYATPSKTATVFELQDLHTVRTAFAQAFDVPLHDITGLYENPITSGYSQNIEDKPNARVTHIAKKEDVTQLSNAFEQHKKTSETQIRQLSSTVQTHEETIDDFRSRFRKLEGQVSTNDELQRRITECEKEQDKCKEQFKNVFQAIERIKENMSHDNHEKTEAQNTTEKKQSTTARIYQIHREIIALEQEMIASMNADEEQDV